MLSKIVAGFVAYTTTVSANTFHGTDEAQMIDLFDRVEAAETNMIKVSIDADGQKKLAKRYLDLNKAAFSVNREAYAAAHREFNQA